jgi:hypothetical protein
MTHSGGERNNVRHHKMIIRTVAIALLLATGVSVYYWRLLLPRHRQAFAERGLHTRLVFYSDFYHYWYGTRELFRGGDPYDPQTARAIETQLYGRPIDRDNPNERLDEQRFSYPAYVGFLIAPLIALPFLAAQIIFAIILTLGTLASVPLWRDALGLKFSRSEMSIILIMVLSSYPVQEGLSLQQVSVLVMGLLAAAGACWSKGRLVAAGILLGLASVKPHVIVLFVILAAIWAFRDWRRRKAIVFSFLMTVGVLAFGAELLLPSWPLRWLGVVGAFLHDTSPGLLSVVTGEAGVKYASAILFCGWLILSWMRRRELEHTQGFGCMIALASAVSVLLQPNINAVYNQMLLLPGVMFLYSSFRKGVSLDIPGKAIVIVSTAAISWYWIGGSAVALMSMFSRGISDSVLALPLRTAAAMPFLILIMIVLTMLRARTGNQIPCMAVTRSGANA